MILNAFYSIPLSWNRYNAVCVVVGGGNGNKQSRQ